LLSAFLPGCGLPGIGARLPLWGDAVGAAVLHRYIQERFD